MLQRLFILTEKPLRSILFAKLLCMNKIGKILSIDSKYVISLNRDACFEMCKDCLNIIKKAHPDFEYTYLHSNTGGATYFRLDAGKYPEIDDMRGMFD